MKKLYQNPDFRDVLLISIRCLLAAVFLVYGGSKLAGMQFGGLSSAELGTPIAELSLFKIAWHLFGHEPFNLFTGICEIIAAVLLLLRRTAVIGTLMLIPIIANILIIDIMIMPPGLKISFIFRLSFYLLFCFLLLYAYKDELFAAWKLLTAKRPHLKHPWWQYLLVPVLMVVLELISPVFKILYLLLVDPHTTMTSIGSLFS